MEKKKVYNIRVNFRPKDNEVGPFQEHYDNTYKFWSDEPLIPGDVVIVPCKASVVAGNYNKWKTDKAVIIRREAVVTFAWEHRRRFSQVSPTKGYKVISKTEKTYKFQNRTGLNHPELRKNYYEIVKDCTYLKEVKERLRHYGYVDFRRGDEYPANEPELLQTEIR